MWHAFEVKSPGRLAGVLAGLALAASVVWFFVHQPPTLAEVYADFRSDRLAAERVYRTRKLRIEGVVTGKGLLTKSLALRAPRGERRDARVVLRSDVPMRAYQLLAVDDHIYCVCAGARWRRDAPEFRDCTIGRH